MSNKRIAKHPIIKIPKREALRFYWNGYAMTGYQDEVISSALLANEIEILGYHPKDNSPQGIFCANGQCSQCLVMADGIPAKACMTTLRKGMRLESISGLPQLLENETVPLTREPPVREVEVLIIGGGPAGMSAAFQLGQLGADTLLIDDKVQLGGKLLLQTHKFFGSVADSYAGTRGFAIAAQLEAELRSHDSVDVWLQSTAVGLFSDGIVGVVKGRLYRKVRPRKLLVAAGAREMMLSFPGNTLPGIYGAGAFQTLVNRDLIRSSQKLLIVGGGNVGLIAGYHAIQAGIEVVALIEGLPAVGGYKVHADKLKRLGVPILTGHTVVCAEGREKVERVTVAAVDEKWKLVEGTHKTLQVDTVLIAVGLAEVNEFYLKARQWGLDVYAAGDAREIAEASAAMFAGKIEGLRIAVSLGLYAGEIPIEWERQADILKSKPGEVIHREKPAAEEGVFPIFHCLQEVPCNPCTAVCPSEAIRTEGDTINGLPYMDDSGECKGCLSCVAVCPGLAVSVVDYRSDPQRPTVTLPYEIWREEVEIGRKVPLTDCEGVVLGRYEVERVVSNKKRYPGTLLVQLRVDRAAAKEAAGIGVERSRLEPLMIYEKAAPPDEAIVCRCERVTAGEIRAAVRKGVRDTNQIKALTRAGMGACGSKTCRPLIHRLFKDEGIELSEVTDGTDRPLFVEVPMGVVAGVRGSRGHG